jgi:hypothetical protein
MTMVHSVDMSGITNPATQHNNPEAWILNRLAYYLVRYKTRSKLKSVAMNILFTFEWLIFVKTFKNIASHTWAH